MNDNLINKISFKISRLGKIFQKDFLDCQDIMKITGKSENTIRSMMHRKDFPLFVHQKRNIVSIASYVLWEENELTKESINYDYQK